MTDDQQYLHGHHESLIRSFSTRTATNSATFLLSHLRPGLHLLDVGCGPGTLTASLAAYVAPTRVMAVDAERSMGPLVKAEAEKRGQAVDFAVGDIYDLDIPDDSFDVVLLIRCFIT